MRNKCKKSLAAVLFTGCAWVPNVAHSADYWFCNPSVPVEKPGVKAVNGLIKVDNRCNETSGLVIVYRMYENSSETFWADPNVVTSEATLHSGNIRVWIRFDNIDFNYKLEMK